MPFVTIIAAVLLAQATAAPPSALPFDIAAARQSTVGRWQGTLEYRDYQSGRWFPLPVRIEVRDGGDGVTLIRTADHDDGPATGNVRITTVSMLAANGRDQSSATFRRGREVELETAALALAPADRNAGRWTLVETIQGKDDDRPATLRYTIVADGDRLVTTKEIDFADDPDETWIVRNRTSLTRITN